jgi:ubiquilin
MGPPPDPEQMIQMMRNPQFQSTMNEALQNPAIIDMMIQQNPMLRDMGPGIRQMMQSPEFRRMMTDPDALAQQMNMQRALGLNPFGGGGAGQTAFPAPGATNTTEGGNNATGNAQNPNPLSPPAFNPFAAMGGANGANPFAALFGQPPAATGTPSTSPPPAGQTAPPETTPATNQDNAQGGTNPPNTAANPNPFAMLFDPNLLNAIPPPTQPTGANPASPPPPQNNPFANNPFLQNPQLFQQFMGAMNPQNPSSPPPPGGIPNIPNNPMLAQLIAGLGGQAGTPPPTDTRPPEERYAEQLRQLNDMGFYEFERNVEALRRTGGSVQGAVEYLLTHP